MEQIIRFTPSKVSEFTSTDPVRKVKEIFDQERIERVCRFLHDKHTSSNPGEELVLLAKTAERFQQWKAGDSIDGRRDDHPDHPNRDGIAQLVVEDRQIQLWYVRFPAILLDLLRAVHGAGGPGMAVGPRTSNPTSLYEALGECLGKSRAEMRNPAVNDMVDCCNREQDRLFGQAETILNINWAVERKLWTLEATNN